jgi:hypothetical protein
VISDVDLYRRVLVRFLFLVCSHQKSRKYAPISFLIFRYRSDHMFYYNDLRTANRIFINFKSQVILSVIHHYQNPLECIWNFLLWNFARIYRHTLVLDKIGLKLKNTLQEDVVHIRICPYAYVERNSRVIHSIFTGGTNDRKEAIKKRKHIFFIQYTFL